MKNGHVVKVSRFQHVFKMKLDELGVWICSYTE